MRLSSLLLVGAAALANAFDFDVVDDTKENTYFNSIKVPPMLELTPDNFVDAVESVKYMLIKHYSPYCPHCIDYAPTFQTLYEFYYTLQPEGTDKSFTEYYDYRFAMVNCVAFYDMCQAHKVKSYPSTILYVDGQQADLLKGVKNMDILAQLVEGSLEEAHPGSRPEKLLLPKPGDKKTPVPGEEDDVKDTKDKDTKDKDTKDADTKDADTKDADTKDADTKDADKAATVSPALPAEPSPTPKAKPSKKAAPIPPKERGPSNINGISVPLTSTNFDTLVTESKKPWFIKFYAPWCHHCQSLAPMWKQMATEMKDKVDIGEVNCDQETKLCKSLKVHAYPTILFLEGEERVEYQGLRGMGDLVRFAKQGLELTTSVPDVDAASFKELEEKEDVIFVYFYDQATTSEDFKAVQRLPLHLIGRAKLVTTSDPIMFDRFKITSWPRLVVSREGRPTYYNPLTPPEIRDVPLLLNWMKSVWLPIVPELTAASAREIMDGKIVVLAVLNHDNPDAFTKFKRELKSAANEWMDQSILEFQQERKRLRDAKQMRIEEAEDRNDQRGLRNAKNIRIDMNHSDRKEVTFAWVDGVFWQRWIKTTYGFDVREGERIIINDEDNRRYWDTTTTGNYILVTRTAIMETLNKVVKDPYSIKPKFTISSFFKIFFDIKMFWLQHTYMAIIGTVGSIYLIVQWLKRQSKSGGGYLKLDENMTGLGIKRAEAGFTTGGGGKND